MMEAAEINVPAGPVQAIALLLAGGRSQRQLAEPL